MTANPAQTPAQKAARRAVKGVGPDTDIAGNPLTDEQKATMREIEARWAREDAMTANPLAALLDGVRRHRLDHDAGVMLPHENGNWVQYYAALAALAAMTKERDVMEAQIKQDACPIGISNDARDLGLCSAATCRACLARHMAAWREKAKAAETALAAERAKTAKLVEALARAADLMERHNLSGGLVSDLRAAITEASQ